jgi:Tfp pilus assembly protein PilF
VLVLNLKQVRPLDAAIIAVAVVVVCLGAYLGLSIWAQNRADVGATPASRAIESLSQQVRQNPNNIAVRMQLAQAFSVAGRDKDAVRQYELVLSINKDYVPALSGLGFTALRNKDWKTGEGYFRRVVTLMEGTESRPSNSSLETAYFYLGTALMEQKKYEEAIGTFKAAIRMRRDASDSHYALAKCYEKIGVMDGYREELKTTLLFDPAMPEANYDYGQLLLKDGDVAGAAEHFRTAVDEAPGVELPQKALDALGTASERLTAAKKLAAEKSFVKATVEARVSVALDPESVPAHMLLASLYESTKKQDKAAEVYRAVLQIDPGNPEAEKGLKRVDSGS